MTRYRLRAVLVLFGVLNLTACKSWQSPRTLSPAQFIELQQPDLVLVTTPEGTQVELENPSVEGDELVGRVPRRSSENVLVNGVVTPASDAPDQTRSVSLADVLMLQVRSTSTGRTVGLVLGVLYGVLYAVGGLLSR